MPFNRADSIRMQVRTALEPFGDSVTRAALWVAYGALALLVVTGEAIRWVDYRDTLVSAPMLRAVHALAGFALCAALLMRIGEALLRAAEAVVRERRLPWRMMTRHVRERLTALHLLDAAWWIVVGLLVLSGLERYTQLRHGVSVLPVLSPAAWWALHRPLLPYLYAILLLNAFIRGRMAIKRALSYLYTP
ncbi:MAG TPA: hypothetical protein VKB51_14395 [bacterium]|nr:hypothetical protein [bacterium]